ncbi:MAG: hypothetical protein M0Z76_01270 [Gammaproteobacteria bacterium]|nr:hypothetical protein [Gammaproteobacteria bacterium]
MDFIDPAVPCPKPGTIRPGATIIEGQAHNGRPCRIIDNTASVDPAELRDVLDALIRERRFGLRVVSPHGGNTLSLDHPETGHIQFGDQLYRLLLFPYEAHIEPF